MGSLSLAQRRHLAIWLFLCAFLVLSMVALGGYTRLSQSGLSITEWKPVTGAIPPLSAEDWQAEFSKYQATPEFEHINFDMDMAGFQRIFWVEYLHRLLGRLVGLVFAVPFLWFAARGYFQGADGQAFAGQLIGIFALGGLQGAMGWYMVKSGLVHDPEVSHYRLAAHLLLAMVIYMLLIAQALRVWPNGDSEQEEGEPMLYGEYHYGSLVALASFFIMLIFMQIGLGAFVAGLKAGLIYNSFPTMNGEWFPDALWHLSPIYRNFTENVAMVQFLHRVGGALVLFYTLLLVGRIWHHLKVYSIKNAALSRGAMVLLIIVIAQFSLGVWTLLWQVPISLGVLHQAGAVVVLTAALVVRYHLKPKA